MFCTEYASRQFVQCIFRFSLLQLTSAVHKMETHLCCLRHRIPIANKWKSQLCSKMASIARAPHPCRYFIVLSTTGLNFPRTSQVLFVAKTLYAAAGRKRPSGKQIWKAKMARTENSSSGRFRPSHCCLSLCVCVAFSLSANGRWTIHLAT